MGISNIFKKLTKGWHFRKDAWKKWHYECNTCGKHLNEGDFIAVIGKTLSSGASTPVGRANLIFDLTGKVYCEDCFNKKYKL